MSDEVRSSYGSRVRKIDSALVTSLVKEHRGSELLIRDSETEGFFVRFSARGRAAFGVAYSFAGRERRIGGRIGEAIDQVRGKRVELA